MLGRVSKCSGVSCWCVASRSRAGQWPKPPRRRGWAAPQPTSGWARLRSEGGAGLEDRSSRPHRSPRCTPPEVVATILGARVERRWGPHRLAPLTEHPRSTVYAVLARAGHSRLRDADRLSGVPVRYVRDHPGALVHQATRSSGASPTVAVTGYSVSNAACAIAAAAREDTTTSRWSWTTPRASPSWPTSPMRRP